MNSWWSKSKRAPPMSLSKSKRELLFLTGAAVGTVIVPAAFTSPHPRRLSVEKHDPGFKYWNYLVGNNFRIDIYLDGKLQEQCIMADPVLGCVKRAKLDEQGELSVVYASRGELCYRTLHKQNDGTKVTEVIIRKAFGPDESFVATEVVFGRVEIKFTRQA